MTVYLDLAVILNFLVDFLLLVGTNRLSGYPAGLGRAALAAVLGGLYSGICLMPEYRFLSNWLWRAVSLGLMGVLAFGLDGSTLRRCVLFALLSCALGGMALGLGTGSFWTLIAACGVVCLMCLVGFRGRTRGENYIHIELKYGGKTLCLTALHDTGNTLRDPVTGEQVLVTDADAARFLLGLTPSQLSSPIETMALGAVPGLRLIPYRAVGQGNGMLLGLRIRDARIGGKEKSVVVAFAPEGLGKNGGAFNALIGGVL